MRKFACLTLIVCLILNGSLAASVSNHDRVTVVSETNEKLSLNFDLTGVNRLQQQFDGKQYVKLQYDGEGSTKEIGMPELPAISRFVIVPGDRSVDFEITGSSQQNVQAVFPPLHTYNVEANEPLNSGFYQDGELYPPEPVVIGRPILIRNIRMVEVIVYPIQYNPSSNSYIERSSIDVDLRFGNNDVINPVNSSFPRIPSPQFQRFIESITLNAAPHRDDRELVEMRGYNEYFLFVLQDDIRDNIEDDVHDLVGRLVEWKRRSGNKVDMLRIPGNRSRNPQFIEDAIREAYDDLLEAGIEPFDNILLIGEDETNPYSGNRAQQGFDLMLVGPTHRLDTNPWVDHYDIKFAFFEGDDVFPDAAISRFHCGDLATLAGGVNKTISYQANPYLEDTDWYSEAIVVEQGINRADESMTKVCDYDVLALERNGFEVVAQWRRADRGNQDPGSGWTADRVNERIGFIAGRAKHYTMDYVWGHAPQNMFRAVGVFPIALLNSGHGEWAMETMFWVGREEYSNRNRIHDVGWAKGAVAITCTYSRPSTDANNILNGSSVHAMLDLKLSFGWMRPWVIMNFARTWPERNDSLEFYASNFGFCGDPSLRNWRGIPRMIEVDHPATIAEGSSYFPILVTDEENEDPIADMMVTVYKGTMNEVEWFETKFTDAEGFCEFIIDPELEGPILVTALEEYVYPYQGEVEREESELFVQASITDIDDSEDGNDDGEVNPGETIILTFSAANRGTDDRAVDVTGVLTSNSPGIVVEGNEITFGNIDAEGEADGEGTATIHIAPSFRDGVPINLIMELAGENGEWTTGLLLDPISFNLEIETVENDGIVPRGLTWLEFELKNIGRIPIPQFSARLVSGGWELGTPVSVSEYPAIPVNGTRSPREEGFRISGNLMAIPGNLVPVSLLIEVGGVVVDTAHYYLQLGEEGERMPQGPDDFGYICFDDTDTSFRQAPEYEWIEVSGDADNPDLNGTQIRNFSGGNNNGYAIVDLPFTFRYYGEEFDDITVCTNGFLTAGTYEDFVPNFQNFPMADGSAGADYGMLAPFWDNLNLTGNNDPGIWFAYDEEHGWFIVEWYNTRHNTGGNTSLRFEVIIYDPEVWANATRDSFIKFQYASISQVAGYITYPGMDTPYASIGISSPSNHTGINYSTANEYGPSSAPITNRRALFFTTSPRQITGYLSGRVTDEETDEPIFEASVFTSFGQVAITDEDGRFVMDDALALEFSLTATKPGYNDSTIVDLGIEEDDTLEVNFSLLHPEFLASTAQLTAHIDPELEIDLPFNIENNGNGPLNWSVERRLPGGAEADPWERRISYPVSDTLQDSRLEGLVFIDDRFYISGANQWERENGVNMLYVLDTDGNLIEEYEQAGESNYGYRDMAFDGELIWASGERTVFGINPEDGEVRETFEGPYSSQQALAWDYDREILWMSGITSRNIVAMTRDGENVAEIPRQNFRIYGLSYWGEDPDDHPLYVFHSPGNSRQVVHKINPEDGDTIFVRELQPDEGGSPGGAFATNQFDVYSWVFMNIANDGNSDRIDVWQLDARRDWFQVNALGLEDQSGAINADSTQQFTLELSSVDLPMVPFEGMLVFRHNAMGGEMIINVLLDVIGPRPPTAFNLISPSDSAFINANQDSSTVLFLWEESIDYNEDEDVLYHAWFMSGENTAFVEIETNEVLMDLTELGTDLGLPIEAEFSLDWWVTAVSGEDTVISTDRFRLNFIPNLAPEDQAGIPVEFGLQSIYPSPFNSKTTVRFGVDRSERIKLSVFNLAGRRVINLFDSTPEIGYHQAVWEADKAPSGLYLIRLEAAGRTQTAKVALIR